ncbi:MAG TPA: transcriptional regulator [Blastocatellia bacterium]|nr:transcriptional regulator [Blastocatellia bacterium]
MIANHSAIDPKRYAKLLAEALPAVIETEEENERLLAIVDKMMGKKLSPEEAKLFDLLVHLIQEFEEKHYPLDAAGPRDVLLHLMEARGFKPRDLWELFGSKGLTSDILSGKREISKANAKKLAEFFKVSPELFI